MRFDVKNKMRKICQNLNRNSNKILDKILSYDDYQTLKKNIYKYEKY